MSDTRYTVNKWECCLQFTLMSYTFFCLVVVGSVFKHGKNVRHLQV